MRIAQPGGTHSIFLNGRRGTKELRGDQRQGLCREEEGSFLSRITELGKIARGEFAQLWELFLNESTTSLVAIANSKDWSASVSLAA